MRLEYCGRRPRYTFYLRLLFREAIASSVLEITSSLFARVSSTSSCATICLCFARDNDAVSSENCCFIALSSASSLSGEASLSETKSDDGDRDEENDVDGIAPTATVLAFWKDLARDRHVANA